MPRTGYVADGTPLSVTQDDFLLFLNSLKTEKGLHLHRATLCFVASNLCTKRLNQETLCSGFSSNTPFYHCRQELEHNLDLKYQLLNLDHGSVLLYEKNKLGSCFTTSKAN